MKKVISLIMVLVLSMILACPAMAVGDDFSDSITYKPVPGLASVDGEGVGSVYDVNGNVIGRVHYENGRIWVEGVHSEEIDETHECLIITPLADAEASTEIPDDARELLLWVYEQILNLGMSFFNDCEGLNEAIAANLGEGKTVEDMVVKDLFDVHVICEELENCLKLDGTTICLDFNFGIESGTFVAVVAYKDGKWQMIEDVDVAGDGSATCTVYENFCPVAVLVPASNSIVEAPQTGDTVGNNVAQWGIIMAVCLAGIVAIVLFMHKRKAATRG